MRIDNEVKLDFKDVLIVPKRSTIKSRKDVDINRTFNFKNSGHKWEGFPLVVANFDVTGTFEMSLSMAKFKAMTALHKYYSTDDLVDFFCDPERGAYIWDYTFYTMGILDKDIEKLKEVKNRVEEKTLFTFPKMLCVDAANGYTFNFENKVRQIREICPETTLMVGNVVTPNIVEQLIQETGADIAKVGLGSGCFVPGTKIKTKSGLKNIEDIEKGEEVLTHKGNFKKVIGRLIRKENKKLLSVNGVKSTTNHEYYVLNKKYKDVVNDDNIDNYAEWISADKLTKNYFLLKIKKD